MSLPLDSLSSSAAAKVSHSAARQTLLDQTSSVHAARHLEALKSQRQRQTSEQGVELETIFSHHQENSLVDRSLPQSNELSSEIPADLDQFLLSSDSDVSESEPMQSRRSTRASARKERESGSPPGNGHASGGMNNHAELRRKNLSLESSNYKAQTENLISRESFSLDEEVLLSPGTPKTSANNGFWDMSLKDRKNFLLLILLYFFQGIPMGLAGGSVPFILKRSLSYGEIGVFSLAIYPYSLKLLWSPIVDAVWSQKVGRRKSWILPIQMLSGIGMIWLGGRAGAMVKAAGAAGGAGLWHFTWWWFFLVFTCATQDIAVDGWALTLLSPANIAYASTAQTVGLTAGGFLSYTVFLAFESPDLLNKYFRKVESNQGAMTLGGYLIFWGWAYMVVTVGLALFKKEEKTRERDGIVEVYRVMWKILKLPNIQSFIIVHLISKLGFQANDAVTNLKLIDKGFGQDNLALTVLIDFPFEIGLGYYVGKWSSIYPPMHLWCYGFVGRLVAAVIAQGTVMIFPKHGVPAWYLLTVIGSHIFSTFTSTIMFVAASAFHAKIADPTIGGTYMTLLATVSNLGGTFPRFFILKLVDLFTTATCLPPEKPPQASDLKGPLITAPFPCAVEGEKHRCIEGGGICNIERDGYYITNIICLIIGVVTFWGYIKPTVMRLQALPLRAWRTGGHS
ncbi:MAG: hypothetical protein M1814_006687 [Vezdaea aestivalis]|nr:MAG: hypothetical protein M1814_006687 [Vezdaea aestivalis]